MKYFATSELGDVVCLESRNGKTYMSKYMYEGFPLTLQQRGFREQQPIADFLFIPAPYITYEIYCKIHQIDPKVEETKEIEGSFEKLEKHLNEQYPFFSTNYGRQTGGRLFRIFQEFLRKTKQDINSETELRFLYCCRLILDKKIEKLNAQQPLSNPLSFVNSSEFLKLLQEAFE
jgi:hypothetical protein